MVMKPRLREVLVGADHYEVYVREQSSEPNWIPWGRYPMANFIIGCAVRGRRLKEIERSES